MLPKRTGTVLARQHSRYHFGGALRPRRRGGGLRMCDSAGGDPLRGINKGASRDSWNAHLSLNTGDAWRVVSPARGRCWKQPVAFCLCPVWLGWCPGSQTRLWSSLGAPRRPVAPAPQAQADRYICLGRRAEARPVSDAVPPRGLCTTQWNIRSTPCPDACAGRRNRLPRSKSSPDLPKPAALAMP